jgi:hypothetical protein
MKVLTRFAVWCLLVCTAACTSTPSTVTLAPIGPRRIPQEAETAVRGSLIVYSAFESVSAASDSELRRHSDYELRSADGTVLQRVVNREHPFSEEPTTLRLSPGHYAITARASRSRSVDVPIVIEADKVTCVRLDGSEPIGSRRVAAAELVRLPDGTPVGWRVRATD